jgi:hypothetical protein
MATALAPPLEFDSELTVSTSHRLQPLAKHSRELDIDEEPPEDDVNAKKPSSLGMDRERGERGNTGESYDSDDEYEVGEMGKKGYYRPEERAKKLEGRWWGIGTMLGFLVRHGCEARGIQPVSVEVRTPFRYLPTRGCESQGKRPSAMPACSIWLALLSFLPSFSLFQDRITLTCWSYLPQATLWAAANTNILTFSAGILGPELFNLPLKTCVGVIIGFNILAVLPVAYLSVSNSSCFVIYAREVEKGVLIDSAPSFSLPWQRYVWTEVGIEADGDGEVLVRVCWDRFFMHASSFS